MKLTERPNTKASMCEQSVRRSRRWLVLGVMVACGLACGDPPDGSSEREAGSGPSSDTGDASNVTVDASNVTADASDASNA